MTVFRDHRGGQYFFTKAAFRQCLLPYGCYHCADGREVLFDRQYRPICQRYPGQAPTLAEPGEWVHWVRQEWFYDDGARSRRVKIAEAKLMEWGMLEPVMERIKAWHHRREMPARSWGKGVAVPATAPARFQPAARRP
jgi:hypothetical protein